MSEDEGKASVEVFLNLKRRRENEFWANWNSRYESWNKNE